MTTTEIAIPSQTPDAPVTGCDSTIAIWPQRLVPDTIDDQAVDDLREQLTPFAHSMAEGVGTNLHHGTFWITRDPDFVADRAVMEEHVDCVRCLDSKRLALRHMKDRPDDWILVGNLYWTD